MPPPAILDPVQVDCSTLIANQQQIQALIPQRFEFALLDGIVLCEKESGLIVGYHDIRPDAWWIRGHIPGRPLFPGVLMVECAAQLTSFFVHHAYEFQGFLGFAGIEETRFRGAVTPPARLLLMGQALRVHQRRTVMRTQGFVGGDMVFEAQILGMVL